MSLLDALGLLLAGLLAGTELVVRYGVQPALARLDDTEGIRARQQVIVRLRVLVPALMIPTVILAVVTALVDGGVLRWVAVALFVAFLLLAFLGTVPINIKVDGWDAAAPPADWRAVIRRWAIIDVFRSSAAILGFAALLLALAI